MTAARRPADELFVRYWEHNRALRTGAVIDRVRASVGLARTCLRLASEAHGVRRETVQVDASPSGELLAELLTHRLGVTTVPRVLLSVLVLPGSLDEYLRGKRRQALRTNLNHARRAEIEVAELRDPTAGIAAYREWLGTSTDATDARGSGSETLFTNPGTITVSATDQEGRLLCMGAAVVSGTDGYLAKLISIRDRPGASEARYAVHTALAAKVIDRGACRLWADGPFTVAAGVQRFQRMLGYECARPRIRRIT